MACGVGGRGIHQGGYITAGAVPTLFASLSRRGARAAAAGETGGREKRGGRVCRRIYVLVWLGGGGLSSSLNSCGVCGFSSGVGQTTGFGDRLSRCRPRCGGVVALEPPVCRVQRGSTNWTRALPANQARGCRIGLTVRLVE